MDNPTESQKIGNDHPLKNAIGKDRTIAVFELGSEGGEDGRSIRLDKDRIVIGSVISADVVLRSAGVSPIHAVIEVNESEKSAIIYDLASETGLLINGKKAVAQSIKAGDELTIGEAKLKFSLEIQDRALPKERFREAEGRRLYLNPNEDMSALLLEDEREVVEIFDYRPSQRQALEVIMSWYGTILDVEHFVTEREVTVGTTRSSDFGIPPILTDQRYSIVTRSGESFVLNINSSMKGVMQRQGKLQSFEEIRQSLNASAQSFQVPINKNDFAKISIEGIDFYMSYTAAPPRLKRRRLLESDPLFFKIFGSSMAFTVLILMAILRIQVPQTLEAEQVPERIAAILYQPEKFHVPPAPKEKVSEEKKAEPREPKPVPPKPKPVEKVKLDIKPNPANEKKPIPKKIEVASKPAPVPKKAPEPAKNAGNAGGQHQAKEGEGARAAGKEGTRGSKNAAVSKEHQNQASRPSPNGGKGRGGGNSQVQDIGNVDFLKSAEGKIENLLGDTAAHLGKDGSKLKGFGGFDTQGGGGLALSGGGKGGGGDAASLGGLGEKGRGGGRVGTGLGAAGSGNGIIGGATRVSIRTGGPEEAVVMGMIDADAVERALLAHRDEFRYCYEKEINAETKDLSGRVGTSFTIGASGRVVAAGVSSSTLSRSSQELSAAARNTESCVLKVIRSIEFPIPSGAGVVEVKYPFKFSAMK